MCQTEDVRVSKTESCVIGERDYLDSITLADLHDDWLNQSVALDEEKLVGFILR